MRFANIMRTVFFSSDYFEEESKTLPFFIGIISFLINVLVLVMPDDMDSLRNLHWNYSVTLLIFITILILIYSLISLFNKELLDPIRYFNTVNFFLMISLVVISVPAFIISHWVAFKLMNSIEIRNLLFTLIPYYTYILFGWLCEKASGRRDWKGVVIAIFSITLLVLFWNLMKIYII